MFMGTTKTILCSIGHDLNSSPEAFGYLQDSSELLSKPDELRLLMQENGYLYIKSLLDSQKVWQARREIATCLANEGSLQADSPSDDCIANPGLKMSFRPDLANQSPTLQTLLYSGEMMGFFRMLLEGEVRHYDYTWLRAIAPGRGTYPHCDSVYMGRGTDWVYTAWTPLGNISWELGGLIILEKSHRLETIKNGYARKDVDSYCTNRKNASMYASGEKWWNGALSNNPVSLRKRYGGRWLSAEFQAGDVLIFSIFTIHASLDNNSCAIRLSSDSRYQLASEPVDERWIGQTPIGHSVAGKRGRLC